MSKIMIIGANGQLGSELLCQLGDRAIGVTRVELDLTDLENFQETISDANPTSVINCGAYTAVDKAEQEQDLCRRVNATAVHKLVEICDSFSIPLVQISSDYIFDSYQGNTPLKEDAEAAPRGYYAYTKLLGEQFAAVIPRNLIVRTCGLYGGGPSQKNFVETMLRLSETRSELRVVADQVCTPSYCRDISAAVIRLLDSGASGTFHVTNSGSTTWYQFAKTIFGFTGREVEVQPISTSEYGAPAPRPRFSVLDCRRCEEKLGDSIPTWQDALSRYLDDRRQYLH